MANLTSSQVWPLRSEAAPVFASLGDRLLAQAVDGLIALALFYFTGMGLAERFGVITESGFGLTLVPALLLVGMVAVVMLAYFILAEAMLGSTLGKLVAQIKVENGAGQRITFRASTIRNLMRLIDAIGFYLVGGISVIVTKRYQRLGDLAAGTVVVRRESGSASRLAALVAVIVLATGGIAGGFWLGDRSPDLPPTLAQYAPKASDAVIKAVSLSAGDSTDLNPAAIGTEFPAGARRVVAWYHWNGAKPGHKVDIRWAKDGTMVLEQNEQFAEPTGSSAWFLDMHGGNSPLPAGSYTVELQENGKRVAAIPFRIGR